MGAEDVDTLGLDDAPRTGAWAVELERRAVLAALGERTTAWQRVKHWLGSTCGRWWGSLSGMLR